ncbi:(2E,6E)-farnesyl diphosphate synthase [Vibrio cincinnatiensis]|jgi:farnesyl diphosphate synthase|uniref:Farnesyl diphosphate synthase n=1 Tax=Vibrio cincinnatiensis DSM 19608 TaxID=1123491 RepID=A0A1T4RWJ2_VIBCI|nr:(2E,6E)-farnesyl diphosphate synthase [Vibrio cincinnatiensis]MCG3723342.1 (2E,6E)-farnesyl diphosphate synthase [Vibrio cincinnatiensis]MCG3725873.1 (2E,6E)-farnesyl diphosphate synthase [Vibrio cincinnatiensis]MCG3732880.1 (2E,6E)-farnesyl diphosphate synthase [Vibrio cincinnatiensis]MCG3736860.1 (2E,6E)-farnesyl diphosphate synthase [Vibrio cincinnatiensis]MCG3740381.1 (2E,6E)-farnesyl diphosphate synthase [Vibrio cincinnatiensis]
MIEALSSLQQRNNQRLDEWLNRLPYPHLPLIEAMRYGLLLGGKRARPYLVYITGQMLGCKLSDLDTPACAVECIHAYSLIHDDLPAMDDDELRRGQPTCHIKFDESTAILTGDALQTLAFTILSEGPLSAQGESNRIKMIQTLAQASGAQGMCLGQALDLAAENRTITLQELETIHHNKTGALMRCAIRTGAMAAGQAGLDILPQLDRYAAAIGLAFQVQDDILDVISDTETLGKPQGSDQQLHKSTYPALLGLEGAMNKAQSLFEEALEALRTIPYNTEHLEAFARYVIERKN